VTAAIVIGIVGACIALLGLCFWVVQRLLNRALRELR
jgi:hypothetical protein